jgi:monofunctional biosynthetic peptidoglycan transglycosylase
MRAPREEGRIVPVDGAEEGSVISARRELPRTGAWSRIVRRVLPRRRWTRALAALLLFPLLAPACQCLWLDFLDPPVTGTMLGATWSHLRRTGDFDWPEHASVDLDDLPRHVARMAVTSEDQAFFEHWGFDVRAIESALRANAKAEKRGSGKRRGASTITQQVARNVFLWQRRSWLRKGLEAYYTVWLELLVPKERILEVYLNVAEMGPRVFGIEAAARHWYGKPAAKLSAHEAASIMAVLPSPRKWNPKHGYAQERAGWLVAHGVGMPGDGR